MKLKRSGSKKSRSEGSMDDYEATQEQKYSSQIESVTKDSLSPVELQIEGEDVIRSSRVRSIDKYGLEIQLSNGSKGFLRRTSMLSNTPLNGSKMFEQVYQILDSLDAPVEAHAEFQIPVVPTHICGLCEYMELSTKYEDISRLTRFTNCNNSISPAALDDYEYDPYPYMLCAACKSPLDLFPTVNFRMKDIAKDLDTAMKLKYDHELYLVSNVECGKNIYSQRAWLYFITLFKKILGPQVSANLSSEHKRSIINLESLSEASDLLGRKIHGCKVRKIVVNENGSKELTLECPGSLQGKASVSNVNGAVQEKGAKKKLRKNNSNTEDNLEKDSIVDALIVGIDWKSQELLLHVESDSKLDTPISDADFSYCNSFFRRKSLEELEYSAVSGKIAAVSTNFVCVLVEVPKEAKNPKSTKRAKKDTWHSADGESFTVVLYAWYMNNKAFDIDSRVVSRERARMEEDGRVNPIVVPRPGDNVKILVSNLWKPQTPFYLGSFLLDTKATGASDTVLNVANVAGRHFTMISQIGLTETNPHEKLSKLESEEEEDDEGSETQESSSMGPKKLTNKEKEYIIDAVERSRRPHGLSQKLPESKLEYEKALLSSPQASQVWIRYLAFMLGGERNDMDEYAYETTPVDIENARRVAERALTILNSDNADDRWNVWNAYLTIEVQHGTAESIEAVFRRFVPENDDQAKAHLALLALYEERIAKLIESEATQSAINHASLAVELISRMVLKFRTNVDVWIRIGKFIITAYVQKNHQCLDDLRSMILRSKKNSAENLSGLCGAFRSIVVSAVRAANEDAIVQIMLPVSSFLYRCLVKASQKEFDTILSAGRAQFEYLLAFNPKKLTLIFNVYVDQEIRLLRILLNKFKEARGAALGGKKDSESQYAYVQNLFRRLVSLPINPRKMERFMGRFLEFEKEFGTEESLTEVEKCAESYAAKHAAQKQQ